MKQGKTEASMSNETALQKLNEVAEEIRVLLNSVSRSMWDVGEKLLEARELYPKTKIPAARRRNTWAEWVRSEFDMSDRFARDIMSAVRTFKESDVARSIPIRTLVELTRSGVPEALVSEVLDEASAGHTPSRDEVIARKKGTLPSPREAREQALASGEYVQASDGNLIAPITGQRQAEIDSRRTLVYEFRDAVEHLADMEITPDEWLDRAADHQTYTQEDIGDVARARDYLASFINTFNKRNKPLLESVNE